MKQDISNEIIILRARKKWTQQELADRVGTTQRTVAAWESGSVNPRKMMLVRIAQAFDLPENYFLDESAPDFAAAVPDAANSMTGDEKKLNLTEEQVREIVKSIIETR